MDNRYKKAVETRMERGSYKHSEEQKKKISNSVKTSHKKKKYGFKEGIASWNKGKTISQETKNKLSKATKKQLAENGHPMKGKKHSEESREKMSKSKIGINKGKDHYNWKGGKPLWRSLRTDARWKKWRELVFKRDNFTCQNKNCPYCRNKKGIKNLHPHHKKPICIAPELCFDVSNGITLCSDYHLKGGLHR
jgi:hypothetical protein